MKRYLLIDDGQIYDFPTVKDRKKFMKGFAWPGCQIMNCIVEDKGYVRILKPYHKRTITLY